MDFQELLSITGSILVALGGASVVLFALGKWLGGVWATRIIDSERAQAAREQERLGRQRNAYAKLSTALRLFLRHEGESWDENMSIEPAKFHEAYDEAALWASDEVMNSIGTFLDLITKVQDLPSSVPQDVLISAYAECISSMRRDCGFPKTGFKYRVVHF